MSKTTFLHFVGLYFFFGHIPGANRAHRNGSACPPSLRKVFTSFCSAVFFCSTFPHEHLHARELAGERVGGVTVAEECSAVAKFGLQHGNIKF